MSSTLSIPHIGAVLFRPVATFEALANERPSAPAVFFGFALWLGLCPPLFAYIGTSIFGWRLGVEPLYLANDTLLLLCGAYFLLLLAGFFSAAVVSQWMAVTYGADASLGRNFALIANVGTPLAIGSVAHLFPHAFLNVLVLVPALIWSMFLLYRGLPVVLRTDPRRGMLMASSLIAYLLVAWVSLIGITAVLWSRGIGPQVAT